MCSLSFVFSSPEEVEGLLDLVLLAVVVHIDKGLEHPRQTDHGIDLRVDVLEPLVDHVHEVALLEVLEHVLVDGIIDLLVHLLVDLVDLVVHVVGVVLDLPI